MNDQTAAEVIQFYMQWGDEELVEQLTALQRLAAYKFDHYEQFSAGEGFFERLARWLGQAAPEHRPIMIDLLRHRLVFLSRDEMHHIIKCVWPDLLRPWVRSIAAARLGIPNHRVAAIEADPAYETLRRQTLLVGLGDGARLDVLRRGTPLSHEQFRLSPDFDNETATSYVDELRKALEKMNVEEAPVFRQVVLVDDFFGTATSLIDQRDDGSFKGKLERFEDRLAKLEVPLLADDYRRALLVYVTSAQAADHIREMCEAYPGGWEPLIAYELPPSVAIAGEPIEAVCEALYDSAIEDEIKGVCKFGYKDARLCLVIHHNTPNNSIALLWASTAEIPDSDRRHALFPRYERHHPDRP